MNKRFFEFYQYASPAILTPLSFWLWFRTYGGEMGLVLMAWLVPILFAYILPGVGTNILKVWEIKTKHRIGRFRIHHGFVFGSATATIAWLCHWGPTEGLLDVLRMSFVFASVLGFWNLIYDVKAIEAGILCVYNQPWSEGKGAEAIAMDYAPWCFAGFGAIYGAGLGITEWMASSSPDGLSAITVGWMFTATLLASLLFPVLGYRRRSFRLHGHSGCRPIKMQ